jgi:hypothetical protein
MAVDMIFCLCQDNPGLIVLVLIDSRLISSRARFVTSPGWKGPMGVLLYILMIIVNISWFIVINSLCYYL